LDDAVPFIEEETSPSDQEPPATRWDAADELRGKMDSAQYKHVVLGLISSSTFSDTFMMRLDELATFAANLHPSAAETHHRRSIRRAKRHGLPPHDTPPRGRVMPLPPSGA
jgi:hypothetical protein